MEKIMKLGKSQFTLSVAFSLAACSGLPPAPSPAAVESPAAYAKTTEVKALLWVGNSFYYYNNSMHGHVGRLLGAAGGRGFTATSATIGGSGFNWHDVDAYFKPGGVGSYSFVGDNEVRFNNTRTGKRFDAAMMMDCSQCPLHPDLAPIFHAYAKMHSATVRKHGAEPIFFMSWAYSDKPEMTEPLANEYIKIGKANNALVVPAGLAFAASVKKRPELSLIIEDKRHPTLMGTYLAACTVMASVYKQNPMGNKYTAGLPADVAAHFQTVAWETAQAFHAAEGRGSL